MRKSKHLLLSLCVILFTLCTWSQNHSSTIKVQALDMAKALIRNDFNTFVKYMHPQIIAFAGGKENMKIKMDSAYQAMKRFNIKFKKYWIDNPGQVLEYKDQLQAVLPVSTTMITPLGEVTAETSVIVTSIDNGKTWWFIDTNVYNIDKLKGVLPDLSPRLVIPPQKKPRFGPAENRQ